MSSLIRVSVPAKNPSSIACALIRYVAFRANLEYNILNAVRQHQSLLYIFRRVTFLGLKRNIHIRIFDSFFACVWIHIRTPDPRRANRSVNPFSKCVFDRKYINTVRGHTMTDTCSAFEEIDRH